MPYVYWLSFYNDFVPFSLSGYLKLAWQKYKSNCQYGGYTLLFLKCQGLWKINYYGVLNFNTTYLIYFV